MEKLSYDITCNGVQIPFDSVSKNVKELIDKLIAIGCVNATSPIEITDALNYYNRICGNTDFSRLRGGD